MSDSATWYFVTICIYGRQLLLGEVEDGRVLLSESGRIATESWQTLPDHFPHVELDAFAIMPNHLHAIIAIPDAAGSDDRQAPGPKPGSLGAVLGSFKAAATRRVNQLGETPGEPLWQSGYHERVLRNKRAVAAMREYIAANPAAWEQDPLNPGGARFRPYCPLPAGLP
jgi:REP element-mobilizing transposase RayT